MTVRPWPKPDRCSRAGRAFQKTNCRLQGSGSAQRQCTILLGSIFGRIVPWGKVGLDVNPKKAVDLLAESASVKNVYAMALLADLNRKGIPDVLPKDIAESVKLYEEAGKLGFLDAKANLGVLYILGEGVQEDKAKAIEIFREGTLKNNALSMFYLAQCLEGGVGVAPDKNEAQAWYVQAAARGNAPAIAWCQKRSIPVPPAPKDANSSGL